MAGRLKGKVAIITGAGLGIGRGHALAFGAEGAKVVVNDPGVARDGSGSDKGVADAVVAEIKKAGGEAVANYDSVVTAEGGENIIKCALDNFGKLDILVNNAGNLRERMIWNLTPEDWDSVIKVHLYGHYNTTKPACTIFRQQRSGRIINTSSGAFAGGSGQANYCAAKGGIVSLTRAVAQEMGRYGVTCNCICPGGATRMMLYPELIEQAKKQAERGIKSWMTAVLEPDYREKRAPEANAPLVVWLASDEAAHVNGCVFNTSIGRFELWREPEVTKSFLKPEGVSFTVDEAFELMPTLTEGLVNPAPPEPPKEK